MLATISGHSPYRLGRGNMSVFTLDTATAGSLPQSKQDVWPNAAGYSDIAQARSGAMLVLYEAGGTVYDYGIKISRISRVGVPPLPAAASSQLKRTGS